MIDSIEEIDAEAKRIHTELLGKTPNIFTRQVILNRVQELFDVERDELLSPRMRELVLKELSKQEASAKASG